MLLDGTHDLLGQRFERPGENHPLLGVDRILDEDQVGDVLHLEGLGGLELLDRVKEIEDLGVTRVSHGAEQRSDQEFTTTTTTVEVDVEEIVVIELNFQPSAAVRDDAARVEEFAVGVRSDLKRDTRRTVKLGYDDALGAVDDEGTTQGHHGDFAHVDFLILDEVFFPEAKLHVEGHRVSDTFAQALDLGVLGITNGVGNVFERQTTVIRLDREYFAENSFEALIQALLVRCPFLQVIEIRTDLEFDQVRWLKHLTELTEVDAIGLVFTDGHGISRLVG